MMKALEQRGGAALPMWTDSHRALPCNNLSSSLKSGLSTTCPKITVNAARLVTNRQCTHRAADCFRQPDLPGLIDDVEWDGDLSPTCDDNVASIVLAAVSVRSRLFQSQSFHGIYGCRTSRRNDCSNECRQSHDHNRARHHVEVRPGDSIKLRFHKSHAEKRDG